MSRSRAPLMITAVAAAGAGYYLYSAGGSASGAEKKFENDLKYARDRATSSNPDAEKFGKQAGAQVDAAVAKAQDEYNRAKAQARDAASNAAQQAEAYGKDVRARVNSTVNEFDKKVEDAAAKTKGGISSWFGGK